MFRLILLGTLIFIAIAFLYDYLKKKESQKQGGEQKPKKAYKKYQAKIDPAESWVQVFETANRDEALKIKARMEEEDVRVILIEQAKKDIQGNVPPGTGLVVPKAHLSRAQNLVCRYLEQH